VALERGDVRTTDKDYAVPSIRDELRYVVRHDLMQNTARDTLTVRNNPSQEALPMRRLGSFLHGIPLLTELVQPPGKHEGVRQAERLCKLGDLSEALMHSL
jgi:hypothetical protein